MLAVNVPVLLAYGIRSTSDGDSCDLYDDDAGQTIFITFFVFAYILPLAIIIMFSVRIFYAVLNPGRKGPIAVAVRSSKSFRKKKQVSPYLHLEIIEK